MKRLLSGLVLACGIAGPVAAAMPLTGTTPVRESPGAIPSKPIQPIPYKKEESGTAAVGQSLAIMAVLLGLGWGGLLLAKRYFPQGGALLPLGPAGPKKGRRLQLIETMRLGPKSTLYLVRLDQQTLLLAQSGDNITVAAGAADVGRIDDKDHQVANSL